MPKKDFKTSGNNKGFFSEETVERVERTESPKPKKKEDRTRRVQLVLPPSLYEDVKKYAEDNFLSINQVFINAVNSFVNGNK